MDFRTRRTDWSIRRVGSGELFFDLPVFLSHVLMHAFHHKGQVVTTLRVLGYPAPDTDLQQVQFLPSASC
ncbi:MAG: hypothetical protein DMG97_33515 [Acidobacteria bacterium]|nr:MAG: hypothetical protein DMG97_33515 [Acidobacteriota bacterium]PYV75066.1 MAG: hypothetical protein DMG96_18340 [Acidobacteriota bacterium]